MVKRSKYNLTKEITLPETTCAFPNSKLHRKDKRPNSCARFLNQWTEFLQDRNPFSESKMQLTIQR
jgi:hypothetical protein